MKPRNTNLLNHEDLQQVALGEKLAVDYFYVPRIYYKFEEDDEEYLEPLIFIAKDAKESQESYASKVPAGMTLWQAVRRDLKKDFGFPDDERIWIENIKLYDTAKNKDGKELTRLLVDVYLELRLKTEQLSPVGFKVKWKHD